MSRSGWNGGKRNWRAFRLLTSALRDIDRYRQTGDGDRAEDTKAKLLEDARAKLGEALQHDPDYLRARYWLGIVNNMMGKTDEAIKFLTQVLAHRPPFIAEVQYNLGVARSKDSPTKDSPADATAAAAHHFEQALALALARPHTATDSKSDLATDVRPEAATTAADRTLQLYAHGALAQEYARMEQAGIQTSDDRDTATSARKHYDSLHRGLQEAKGISDEERRDLEAVAKIAGDLLSGIGARDRRTTGAEG